jgi:hypothetical protein
MITPLKPIFPRSLRNEKAYLKPLGIAVGKAKIFLGPFQGFLFFFFRDMGIIQTETLYLPTNISPVTFVKIEHFYQFRVS